MAEGNILLAQVIERGMRQHQKWGDGSNHCTFTCSGCPSESWSTAFSYRNIQVAISIFLLFYLEWSLDVSFALVENGLVSSVSLQGVGNPPSILLWPKGERELAQESREGGSSVCWARHISIFSRLTSGILAPAPSWQPVSMVISKTLMDLLCLCNTLQKTST